jgi:hypothetical protein
MKGDAPVADAMLVAALIAVSVIAEQQRSRHQHGRPPLGAVLKRSRQHRSDAEGLVPLLEGTIPGT